jgi:phosphoenolpyruvate carboxykinase (GTP)
MANNPALDDAVNDPHGVPISAIIFGGRRATTVPLVAQAFNWCHGVYGAATMGSETTAAAVGVAGQVRRDPFAMLPFCGYNMGSYFQHWINMGKLIKYPPLIFTVNWFRKDKQGKFLWPGFSDNMRVLHWIFERCEGRVAANETAVGWAPRFRDVSTAGLAGFGEKEFDELQRIDPEEWRHELLLQEEFFNKLYDHLPKELIFQRELFVSRL